MNTFTKIIRRDLLGQTRTLDKNMTFAVKANIACGFPASAGSPSLRDWVPVKVPKKKDGEASTDEPLVSPVVRRLTESGHQIVAIANMHELAFGITSENPGFGHVDNPRKRGYIPGGSSGGSAAAVAMNAVSFALGTDTGGSMRIPAALCGVVGFRPTTGLYPVSAVCPLATTDTIGVFAQQVHTVQQVHKIVEPSYSPEPEPWSLSGVRIGVPRQFFYSVLDSEVKRVTEDALQMLRNDGAVLVECDINFPPELVEGNLLLDRFLGLIIRETHHLLPQYLKDQGCPVTFEDLCSRIEDTVVKGIVTLSPASRVSDDRYRECQQQQIIIRDLLADYFKKNRLDAFAVPTTILPAVIKRPTPETVKVDGIDFPTLYAYVHNSAPQASAGVPCISIPSGQTSDGFPVGLELVAPRDEDSSLLNLAAAVQAVLPTLPRLSFDDFKDEQLECIAKTPVS